MNGYKKALSENEINENSDFIITCSQNEVGKKIEELFSRSHNPTAILATNDMILEEVLIWAKDNKISIPDTFSLLGIDEVSFARLYTPEITTLAQPVEIIGTKASELLLQQIREKGKCTNEKKVYRYSTKLIERESVKRINL